MRNVLLLLGLALGLTAGAAAVAHLLDADVAGLRSAWSKLTLAGLGSVLVAVALMIPTDDRDKDAAPTPGAQIELTSATVAVGGRYRITGSGFAAGERVALFWARREGTPAEKNVPFGETRADAEGRLTPVFVTEGADPAQYVILARGQQSQREASKTLTVVPAPAR